MECQLSSGRVFHPGTIKLFAKLYLGPKRTTRLCGHGRKGKKVDVYDYPKQSQ